MLLLDAHTVPVKNCVIFWTVTRNFSKFQWFGFVVLRTFWGYKLKSNKKAALLKYVIRIQRAVRGWYQRRTFLRLKTSILMIQTRFRFFLSKLSWTPLNTSPLTSFHYTKSCKMGVFWVNLWSQLMKPGIDYCWIKGYQCSCRVSWNEKWICSFTGPLAKSKTPISI